MLEVHCSFNDAVNVQRRAAVRAAVIVFYLFYFVLFGIDFAPGGLVRY